MSVASIVFLSKQYNNADFQEPTSNLVTTIPHPLKILCTFYSVGWIYAFVIPFLSQVLQFRN